MRCDLCPGEYLDKLTVIPLTRHGRTIVIEDVPARVCNLCGDRLYSGSTLGRLLEVLDEEPGRHCADIPFPSHDQAR